ncbi:SdpI family protein [Microterricola viridarii]|uniref:SdpI/YhfL protein family protein n=1 Tax=Microterricola viridarii TaxID=412690 RepID=A0A120I0I5_9MICO|nr:SdpI family protein [Microterricola viridarii]AMB59237.1 hypothetical protein AWU67_10595 [Microterricola viridarii]
MIILLSIFPLVLLLAVIACQLGASGRLPRNRYFGVRSPSTRASDAAWRAGHQAALLPAWVGFAVTAVLAASAIVFEGATIDGVAALPAKLVVIAVFAASIVWMFMAANRAARAVAHVD